MAQDNVEDRDASEDVLEEQTSNRQRSNSVANIASKLFYDVNPQRGMWAATGTAIAHAPNLTDLRSPVVGGENVTFDSNGHSARDAPAQTLKQEYLERVQTEDGLRPIAEEGVTKPSSSDPDAEPINEAHLATVKVPWTTAALHGISAFGKFFITPTGFLITIYGLNVVAWGAMLFFLLLHAAPAMDHPENGDAIGSPRRVWIEIDSQILNALFCLTAWGLAPWRFRDLFWVAQWRFSRNKATSRKAIRHLASRNASWFRMRESDREGYDVDAELARKATFSGDMAPPTATWKMDFVVWMLVLNSLLQVGMAFMMWRYNYVDRPSWGSGLFIGLGCAVSMFAGLMSWWEGRKIKLIEGPKVLSDEEA